MHQNFIDTVTGILKERNAFGKCPVCGSADLAVNSGLAIHEMHGSMTSNKATCAIVVCENCGFIREHSLDALGINVIPSSFGVSGIV